MTITWSMVPGWNTLRNCQEFRFSRVSRGSGGEKDAAADKIEVSASIHLVKMEIQLASDRAPHSAFRKALNIGEGVYRWSEDAQGRRLIARIFSPAWNRRQTSSC
jgi:hypothetical protein